MFTRTAVIRRTHEHWKSVDKLQLPLLAEMKCHALFRELPLPLRSFDIEFPSVPDYVAVDPFPRIYTQGNENVCLNQHFHRCSREHYL